MVTWASLNLSTHKAPGRAGGRVGGRGGQKRQAGGWTEVLQEPRRRHRHRRHGDDSALLSWTPAFSLEGSASRSRMGLKPLKAAYGRACTPLAVAGPA